MVRQLTALGFVALILSSLAGCGDSVARTQVSGAITYDGQAVVAGRIYFTPDLAKKNDGPQGFADIKNGKYDTRTGGNGPVPGALLVRIEGFDGQPAEARPIGYPVFVYETSLELAQGAATKKDYALNPVDAPRIEKSNRRPN